METINNSMDDTVQTARLNPRGEMPPGDDTSAVSTLASIFRFLGSCLLLAGAVIYMLEGWYEVDHIFRYLKFLGVTSLLSIAGVLTAVKLNEHKGARTYLVLAAAAIPVNFCQLGALLYSTMPHSFVPASMSQYLLWTAPSLSVALTVTGMSLLILTGIGWLSFSVLGRQGRSLLFPAVIGLNSLLLIPVREVIPVSAIALAAAFAAYVVSRRLRTLHSFKYTLEGMYCRVLLWVPSAILLLRTAIIYDHSTVLNGVLCLYLGGVALAGSRVMDTREGFTGMLEFIGGSLILTGALVEQHVLFEALGVTASEDMAALMIVSLTVTAELVSRVLKRSGSALTSISFSIASVMSLAYMLNETGTISLVICLIVGAIGFISARSQKSVFIATIATALSAAGLINLGIEIIPDLFDSWLAISLLGVAVVFIGSVVEKDTFSIRRLIHSTYSEE